MRNQSRQSEQSVAKERLEINVRTKAAIDLQTGKGIDVAIPVLKICDLHAP
jgi:hypothetical protein